MTAADQTPATELVSADDMIRASATHALDDAARSERMAAARAFAYALYLASCSAETSFHHSIANPYLVDGEDGKGLHVDEMTRLAAERALESAK